MQQQKQKPGLLYTMTDDAAATAEENSIVNNDKLYSNFIYSKKPK
jgi:hypothetical protein